MDNRISILISVVHKRYIKEDTSNLATMVVPISVNIGNGLGPGAQRKNSSENGG